MKFKNSRQRKAVMAKLTYNQLKNKGIKIKPYIDSDKDGVLNYKDCKPLNPKEQGLIHDIVGGIGKTGGYVVGEAKSGWKSIPQQYKRQKIITMEKEELKEAKRDVKTLQEIKKIRTETKTSKRLKTKLIRQMQKGEIAFVKRKGKIIAVRTY